jgi:hypothetical protein
LGFGIALDDNRFEQALGPALDSQNLAAPGTAYVEAWMFLVLQQWSARTDGAPFFDQKPELLVMKNGRSNSAALVRDRKQGLGLGGAGKMDIVPPA